MQIEIAGKPVELFFGMHVFEQMAKYVTDGGDMSHIGFMSMLITAAHENSCLTERVPKPFEVNYRDVRMHIESNVLSDEFAGELQKVIEAYQDSTPKKMVDKINEAGQKDVKKKVVRTGTK